VFVIEAIFPGREGNLRSNREHCKWLVSDNPCVTNYVRTNSGAFREVAKSVRSDDKVCADEENNIPNWARDIPIYPLDVSKNFRREGRKRKRRTMSPVTTKFPLETRGFV
jgi:hypothetical protein